MELLGHGTLYIQRGVASGDCYKRFTLCRKYLDAYLNISGAVLIIMDSGSIRIAYCGYRSTVISTLDSVMIRRDFNMHGTEMSCSSKDVLSLQTKMTEKRPLNKYCVLGVPGELGFATRSEYIDFNPY